MFRFALAMVVFGCVMIYWGYQEMNLASKADITPQVITCEALSDNGPGDNAHVEMSDFILCSMAYVYETVGSSDTIYKTVWVPAVPINGAYHQQVLSMLDEEGNLVGEAPVPTDLAVLVKTSKASSEDKLFTLGDQETLTGLVINEIASLGSDEQELLKESYPGVDFDKVWILEHRREPAGAGKKFGLMGGGILLLLAGLGLGASSMGLIRPRQKNHALAQHPSDQEIA